MTNLSKQKGKGGDRKSKEYALTIDCAKELSTVENQDYQVFDNFIKNPNGGRPLTEYAMTVDAAKELLMFENQDYASLHNFVERTRICQLD